MLHLVDRLRTKALQSRLTRAITSLRESGLVTHSWNYRSPNVVLVQDAGVALRAQAVMHSSLIGAVLYAKDLPRLAEFYRAVVGLQVQTMQEGIAVLGHPPSQLAIVRIPKRIAETITIETPP